MTEKVDIFMPIIWADYEKKTSKLSMLEHGAYMLLLKEYWNNGGAIECECDANALPTHMRFYRSCRAMAPDEQSAIDYILGKFFTYSEGCYHQARADEELEKAREKRRKAKESADKRWNKTEENEPMRSHMRSDMPTQCSTPTPTQSNIYPDWLDLELWQNFVQHRKFIKSPMSKQSEKVNITNLQKLIAKGYTQEQIINLAIGNNWKGFFEPKGNFQQAQPALPNKKKAIQDLTPEEKAHYGY